MCIHLCNGCFVQRALSGSTTGAQARVISAGGTPQPETKSVPPKDIFARTATCLPLNMYSDITNLSLFLHVGVVLSGFNNAPRE